jgi:hypothetical protein
MYRTHLCGNFHTVYTVTWAKAIGVAFTSQLPRLPIILPNSIERQPGH